MEEIKSSIKTLLLHVRLLAEELDGEELMRVNCWELTDIEIDLINMILAEQQKDDMYRYTIVNPRKKVEEVCEPTVIPKKKKSFWRFLRFW